jgi:TolC family type I secretion outer membrane protein
MGKLLKKLRGNRAAVVTVIMIFGWCQPGWSEPASSAATDLEGIEVLDLSTAAGIALEDNPSLEAARARVGQAREAVRQAQSAYWPRIDLKASRTRVDLSDNGFASQEAISQAMGAGVSFDNPEDYYRAQVEAGWLIFDGFTRWFTLAAAKHGAHATAEARNDARRLLLQAVSTAFVQAQFALENVAIAKADESFNQRQLTEAKLRHEVGTGALSDVLNFEVKANSAQSDRIVADRTYETSRIALAALLGIENARLPRHTALEPLEGASEAELKTPQVSQLIEEAFVHRPDLLQNDWGVQQAAADVKAKRGGYFPTLSLIGSYDAENNDDFGFESDDIGSTVGVHLSYPIFAGGLIHARHQEAKMGLREAQKRRENVKINVTSEVRTTLERLNSAQKQLLLQRTNAGLVQKNRDLVDKEYKAGVGSLVRLNEAQRDLIAAQVRLAGARVALRQAWYDLWSATGRIEANLAVSE